MQADEPAHGKRELSGRMRLERRSRRIRAHVDMFVDDGGEGKNGRIDSPQDTRQAGYGKAEKVWK